MLCVCVPVGTKEAHSCIDAPRSQRFSAKSTFAPIAASIDAL